MQKNPGVTSNLDKFKQEKLLHVQQLIKIKKFSKPKKQIIIPKFYLENIKLIIFEQIKF